MAELTAKLFRDYFGGSWLGKVTKNGEFQREITFNWPSPYGNYAALGTEAALIVPPDGGVLDNTRQIIIAGWRSDVHRWCCTWHNEFGGHGELQWSSQEMVNGVTVLYGLAHECKQETDDPTDHIVMCEMFDPDNFKYTIRSFRKGLIEIVAERIRTRKALDAIMKAQVKGVKSIASLAERHKPAKKKPV